jgi:Family of unknown function (DUF5996)
MGMTYPARMASSRKRYCSPIQIPPKSEQGQGFADAKVPPSEAFYSGELGEFIFPYDAMRSGSDPESALLAFLQSTYEAAASLGRWDRTALEKPEGQLGRPPSG